MEWIILGFVAVIGSVVAAVVYIDRKASKRAATFVDDAIRRATAELGKEIRRLKFR